MTQLLKIKKVSKQFLEGENKVLALHNVSVSFEEGQTCAIVGKSGSGKSTLIHILTGLDHPTSGEVLYKGKNIATELDTDKWRGENIGIVFQQFFLMLNDTVLNNVMLPLKIQGEHRKQRRQMASEALQRVGLSTKLDNKANDLSGGQKQRVAVARAIVGGASILIADEPTGNLDSENSNAVADLLFDLNKKYNTTVIIITHDEDLARRCQRIVRLSDGTIISDELTGKEK